MKLKKTEFFNTSIREKAFNIIDAGLSAVDTKEAISKRVRLEGDKFFVDQKEFTLGTGKLVVLGVGKCSGDALSALAPILGERMSLGFAIDIVSRDAGNRFEIVVGDHPYPSERNIEHTKKLYGILSELTENDRVIFIISGGGTVLLSQPPSGFSSEDETELIKILFSKGADIREMNAVRKHLSFARGGFLATVSKAKSISLIFSDVIGNDPSVISSGPTIKDETTIEDAKLVIKKYADETKIGLRAMEVLIETPKDDSLFQNSSHVLFMSNKVALETMAKQALIEGFTPKIMTDVLWGDANEIGVKIAKDIAEAPSKTCLLYGGETTVVFKGSGVGGRNRHLALSALLEISEGCLIGSVASDGIDNGPYAGAVVDTNLLNSVKMKDLDPEAYLLNSDSGTFFEKVGGFLESGSTGSNVADLIIALKE